MWMFVLGHLSQYLLCVCVPCERHWVMLVKTAVIHTQQNTFSFTHWMIKFTYLLILRPFLRLQFMLKNWPHKLTSQQPHTVSQAWPLTPGSISAAVSAVYPWGSRSLVSVHPRYSGQDLSVIFGAFLCLLLGMFLVLKALLVLHRMSTFTLKVWFQSDSGNLSFKMPCKLFCKVRPRWDCSMCTY